VIGKIGKYEILRKVGTGGFGSVYEARDPLIRRNVAVKTCEAKDSEVRARFFQEAQLGGSLRHRNITTVYDFGLDDGTPYIVQEFLDGEDLDQIIARGGLSLLEKLQILIGVAYGLEYAHVAGIVHQDVKPRNIRILSDGTVKLMDFGIAKLTARAGRYRTGRNMGTLAYLAPERILDKPVDARADVFSFGVVAYELLAGKRPFDGETEEELFDSILNAEPAPLATIAPDVPPALASIVQRALRKASEDRYPSIEPMRKALLAAFHGLFGREAPVTAVPDRLGTASVWKGVAPDPVADTQELLNPTPGSEPPIGAAPATDEPRLGVPPSSATFVRPERSRFAPTVLAAGLIALGLAGILLVRGTGGSPAADGKMASGKETPGATSVPNPAGESSRPVALGGGASVPSAPADAPHAAPRASVERGSAPVYGQAPRRGRAVPPPASQIASKKATSRYVRAADEPGLSPDTRAAIYVSGAWERYHAGDLPAARELLASAFALRRDLVLDPNQNDVGFRRLADRVRSEEKRSF